MLTASIDKTARLWDPETGQCKQVLEGHGDEIFCCAFNYDGNTIITGQNRQVFHCAELVTGRRLSLSLLFTMILLTTGAVPICIEETQKFTFVGFGNS